MVGWIAGRLHAARANATGVVSRVILEHGCSSPMDSWDLFIRCHADHDWFVGWPGGWFVSWLFTSASFPMGGPALIAKGRQVCWTLFGRLAFRRHAG